MPAPDPLTLPLAALPGGLDEDEAATVTQGLDCLDAVGASALVGTGRTPAGAVYLVAIVFVDTEGSIEVSTEPEALAGHPLGFQALALTLQLRDLAERLTL